VNGLNQYTAAGPASFDYDANGNLKTDGTSSYVYDSENRLVSASGAKNASVACDPLGRCGRRAGRAGAGSPASSMTATGWSRNMTAPAAARGSTSTAPACTSLWSSTS